MLRFKIIITCLLVLMSCNLATPNSTSKNEQQALINCSILRKCSTVRDAVWATPGNKTCYCFTNACIFGNEMCKRRAKNQKEFEIVPEEKRCKYCKNSCIEYGQVA